MPGSRASVSPRVGARAFCNWSAESTVTGCARSKRLLGSGVAVTTTGGRAVALVAPGFALGSAWTGGGLVCAHPVAPSASGARSPRTNERAGGQRQERKELLACGLIWLHQTTARVRRKPYLCSMGDTGVGQNSSVKPPTGEHRCARGGR